MLWRSHLALVQFRNIDCGSRRCTSELSVMEEAAAHGFGTTIARAKEKSSPVSRSAG
jgi:hypothetical protein